MKQNITSAFLISGMPFIAQCAYSKTTMPTRRLFTRIYGSVTDYIVSVIAFSEKIIVHYIVVISIKESFRSEIAL